MEISSEIKTAFEKWCTAFEELDEIKYETTAQLKAKRKEKKAYKKFKDLCESAGISDFDAVAELTENKLYKFRSL